MLSHCILFLQSILPWSSPMANPSVRSDQFFYSVLSIHVTRCSIKTPIVSYHIACLSITYYVLIFFDFDPLHDQVVLACAVLLELSIDFVAAEHPIMLVCLQLVVKEAQGLQMKMLIWVIYFND
jgi:hypothetical protein